MSLDRKGYRRQDIGKGEEELGETPYVAGTSVPGAGAILSFEEAVHRSWVGGKAFGLGELMRAGLPVPEGFVVLLDSNTQLDERFWDAWRRLDGPVAVRSSAPDEDGSQHSFAGQFETVLDVTNEEELRHAVHVCLESAGSARVRAYREELAGKQSEDAAQASGAWGMPIVVQRMVDAKVAGVLFTVDPVTGRRDRMVVDAVPGLGEKLVSGRSQSVHYELTRDGRLVRCDGRDPREERRPLLSPANLQKLVVQAQKAEARFGIPLDMEWAFDRQGRLWWVQARPATGIPADPQEFDTPVEPGDLFTSANFGEMMPGAVPPLTMSLTGWAIDQGIQEMLVASGMLDERLDRPVVLARFWGHFFANLRPLFDMALRTAGSSPQYAMIALCGRVIPGVEVGEFAPGWVRAINAVGYLRYVLSGPKASDRLERLARRFRLVGGKTAAETWRIIDGNLDKFLSAMDLHLRSSAVSGLTNSILQGLVSKGREPSAQDAAVVAELLSGVGDVESAVLLADLGRVVDSLAALPDVGEKFVGVTPEKALAWIRTAQSGLAGALFDGFLLRHGHRAFRELSLREPSWRDDPLPLVQSMQLSVAAKLSQRQATDHGPERSVGRGLSHRDHGQRSGVQLGRRKRWFVKIARRAVWRREHTKSLLVRVGDEFKRAYRLLARQAVDQGLLPDPDAIYFLTHVEVGLLVQSGDGQRRKDLVHRALARKRVYPVQEKAMFPDVFTDVPDPLEYVAESPEDEETLRGRPVSPGKVVGRARVAHSIVEAAAVEPGDILVAPVTDVGWTPYFRVISGLATDVGSAISHGAVVAREYGLPAVVGLRNATTFVQNGSMVELDGTLGTLRKL